MNHTTLNDGGPAFPQRDIPLVDASGAICGFGGGGNGMSLRDYFAAAALQGLIAQSGCTAINSDHRVGAEWAYAMADAMLRQREKVEAPDE